MRKLVFILSLTGLLSLSLISLQATHASRALKPEPREEEHGRAEERERGYKPEGFLALQNPLQIPTPPAVTDPDEHPEPTGPMVSTDRSDYEPGETATITGTRFHPNETVTLRVTHIDGTAEGGEGHEPWTATTDAEGNFTTTWFVNPDDSRGSSFKLTADCADGLHAQNFFTDAGPVVASGYSIREVASGGLLAGQILDGVVADPSTGNVYVAGVSNTSSTSMNLYKITPAGVVSLVGTYAFGHNEVVKMAIGPDGKIYTVDKNTGTVKTINPATGAAATFASGVCAGCRYGLNFDPAGNLILGYESMFDFYKVTPGGLVSLGHVSASVPNNNHGDSFGIQPDGNYVVYVDCGGQNNYSINTAGHTAGTNYSSLAWTGTTNVFDLMPGACGYSNGAIDPNTGEVYSTVSNFGSGNSTILYTDENGGPSNIFVSGASGITDLTFGKSSTGSCNSLYFVDRTLNKVFEVPMNNCCSPMPDPVTVIGGGEFCETATITAAGGTGGTIYFQGTTSRGTSTARPSTSEVVTSSGTYYFRSMSPSGCWGKPGAVTVKIKPAPATPVISPSGPIEYFAGNSTMTTLSIPAPVVSPAKTYNIPLANLVNMPNDCGSGSKYGDGDKGFSWNDTGSGVATNVQIKFSVGVECNAGAHTSALNGLASSGFNT
ncbi:MAG: large repetitive protein, partial [Acidobacteriota bacterium]|nr:large repetitive protein [Acidobacteriota bacterium]